MPFPMLIDEDRRVTKAFDVFHAIGIDAFRIAHPSMFLVTEEGTVEYLYVGKNQTDRPTHEQTLKAVMEVLHR